MTADPRLIKRSGELKPKLIDYAKQRRFDRDLRRMIQETYGRRPRLAEDELINVLDRFTLQERLRDGRTVVDHYVAEHPRLPEEERALLLGWKNVVEGLFEVVKRDGNAVILVNLLDELTYRTYSNKGPEVINQLRPKTFLITRVVPIGDEWMFSGAATLYPAMTREQVDHIVFQMSTRFPEQLFRNPEKLAQAWELQREERAHFIAFFGSDTVVMSGEEVAERTDAYFHYRTYETRDAEGKTPAERHREVYGTELEMSELEWPSGFLNAASVGVIYDEVEGMGYFLNYALAAEAFADPRLATEGDHREVIEGYLKDPDFSPVPLRRLAAADPEKASQVFAALLGRPDFSWERDGEALLRRYKAAYLDRPPLPRMAPVHGSGAKPAATEPERPRRRPGDTARFLQKKGAWQKGPSGWPR